jgi:hypothetical protein
LMFGFFSGCCRCFVCPIEIISKKFRNMFAIQCRKSRECGNRRYLAWFCAKCRFLDGPRF